MKEFNIDYDTLYQVWLMFCGYIADGKNSLQAIELIEKYNIDDWNKALKFFTYYGFNIITNEMNNSLKEKN